jgi:DNA-binding SARP family transcriptional activator/tetratricopeptide (TPR) repeat protein
MARLPVPSLLYLSLLGPPVIKYAEAPLAISRRQVRALLFRLAVESRPLSRSYLGCLFWGHLPESTAQRNLSRLLVYLSHNLPDPGVLQVDEDHIQLDPVLLWVDTQAFNKLWKAWECTGQLDHLQTAAALYRGSFLNGFILTGNLEYAEWTSLEQENWEQRYLKALEALIDAAAAQGQTAQAIDYARQYLLHNNLAEAVHCRLIALYATLGDRSAAIRQYERCREILERDLGVKPAPETHAAYLSALDPRYPESELLVASPSWKIAPSLEVPFIGRQEILKQLVRYLDNARTGNSRVVMVSGESGIGKSRLLKEFTRRPLLRTRVMVGQASPEMGSMPYQPIIEALRPLLSMPDVLPHLHFSWLAEVSRLMPELAALVQSDRPPEVLEAGEARARIFEALSRIIFAFSGGGYTVLLCFDDLQWADSTTLDWLAYLGRRLLGQRLLILGSYRLGESDNLAELRQILARQANFTEIHLPGLDEEEVRRLMRKVGEVIKADRSQVGRLCRATGGNPFFILETLRVLLESASSADQTIDWDVFPLPDSVCQAVNFRLDKLHPHARQILEAGAILGQYFDFESILLTAGRGEMETLDGLDELVARQFLVEKAAGYQFCHAIVQDAVYAGLTRWRRCRLHRRAGEALEKLRPGDTLPLSWHFEQANEPSKSAGYLFKAGLAARAVYAHVEARNCFDRALGMLELEATSSLSPEAMDTNRRQRIQVLYERGWALRLLGEMDTYTSDLEEVKRLAQDSDDPRALAHLHWQQAYNHRWFCRYDAARSAAEKGVRLSQEIGDPFLRAVCQRELGMVARETGEYASAQIALEQSLKMFIHLQKITYSIHTLGNLSTLCTRMQEPERAMRLACQAMEICEQNNLRYERRVPLGDMGVAAAALGDLQKAQSLLQESLSIARQIADRTQEIFCQGHLGCVLAQDGQPAQAAGILKQALALSENVGSLSEQSWLHACLAENFHLIGDKKQAETHARTAFKIAAELGRKADALRAQQILSRMGMESGP